MTTHAKYSPSALSRIEQCPASIHGRHIDIESEYASEGTEFAEWCEKAAKSEDWTGATEEFQPYLDLYLELLVAIENKHGGLVAEYVEERLPNEDGFSGTPDYAAVGADGVGIILDIKYGTGIQVAAEGNMQLLSYAALLLESHPELKEFTLIIFQPRLDPQIQEVEVSKDEIEEFVARRHRIKEFAEGEGFDVFNDGDHCQFCPRLMDCPLKVEPTRDIIEVADNETDLVTLRPEEIYRIAAMESKVKEVFRDAKAIIEAGLKDGSITPEESGFKLVGTLGNRAWDDGVGQDLVDRYGKEAVIVEKLASPNQLETAVRKTGQLTADEKDFIAGKVVRKPGIKLVPISHKGQHLFADRNDFETETGDIKSVN